MDKTSTDLELALRLVKNGDDESATQVFNKILKENEKEPVALEFFAVKEIKAKNYKNAIHLLKQALRSNECRASVLFQMGHALRDSGNISKAEQFYSRYYSITNDYKAAITYADILIKLSKSNEAIHILNQIELKHPRNIKILSLKSLAYKINGNEGLSIKLKKEIIKLEALTPEETLIKSGVLMDLGLIDDSLKIVGNNINCMYGDELRNAINNYKDYNKPIIYGSFPQKEKTNPLILVSCNLNYYQQFFKNLLSSLNENSGNTDIHVHLISKSEPDLSLLNLNNASLTWEIDNCLSNIKYATRRYTLMPTFLNKLNRPIIVLDIDSLVKKDIEYAIKSLPKFDVAMYLREDELYINQKLAAGICIFSNSNESILISKAIASYILYFEEKKIDKWFVDQMALIAIYNLYSDNKNLNIINIPKYFLDWDVYRSESIVWTSKGNNKNLPSEGL